MNAPARGESTGPDPASNRGQWEGVYAGAEATRSYGDSQSYEEGALFLAEMERIEDWGCGLGWFRQYIEPERYIGVDGSRSPFADKVVDLADYVSDVDGLFLRHVLEHNHAWDRILGNAIRSFRRRMVLVLFTPFVDRTRVIHEARLEGASAAIPDIAFAKSDLTRHFAGLDWRLAEGIASPTQYGIEHIFFLERPGPSRPAPPRVASDAWLPRLQKAAELHRQGRLDRAESLYREVLALAPNQPDALNLLGVVAYQRGRCRLAVVQIRRALAIEPDRADMHNNLGEALRAAGQFERAAEHYRQAIRRAPGYAEAHNNLGIALQRLGRFDEAAGAYASALRLQPQMAGGWLNWGALLQELGRDAEAEAAYARALELDPGLPEAHNNLGILRRQAGDLEAAEHLFRRAIDLAPNDAAARVNRAGLLRQLGRGEEAVGEYRRALAIEPGAAATHVSLARALAEIGDTPGAADALAAAQRQQPDSPRLRLLKAGLCPLVWDSRAEIAEYRARLLETIKEQSARPVKLPIDGLESSGLEPPFGLFFQGEDDLPIKRAYGEWFGRALDPFERPGRRTGRPSLGLVVTLGHHAVFAKSMLPILDRIVEPDYRIVIFAPPSAAGYLRDRFTNGAIELVEISERFRLAAKTIAGASLDVLFHWEIGTDSTNYFLPYLGLAPLQATSWGVQVTSGVPAVDVYVSSGLAEPAGGERHYSEELVRLPTLLSFERRPTPPRKPKPRGAFSLPEGGPVYLCPQNLGKLHPDFDPLLRGILERDPRGLIVFLERKTPLAVAALQRRFARGLGEAALRVRFLSWQEGEDYQSLILAADVLLDPPHFSGANSTLDALGLGKAVVAYPGEFHRGRYTLACCRRAGLEELVAKDAEDYVRLSVELATDQDRRRVLEEAIRDRSQALFEDESVVRAWRQCFEDLLARSRSR